ncbi:DUF499 domain-containing protein [Neobacillus sp. YIM B06451]|uniref:DUF499 domain-containing protein n=1 Tax=Neobacillus sp. YIM B06451 TaxID=3070994 RepID=UPI0029313633|nr:DUF499 domain-containing protein [Neobacillus sp. YIM B06451]
MAMSNYEKVGKGLELLKKGLLPFVEQSLKKKYEKNWIRILSDIPGFIGIDERKVETEDEILGKLDVQVLLTIMWKSWMDTFHSELGYSGRSYVSELKDIGSQWARQQPFSIDDTHRALDTMARLLHLVSSSEAIEVERISKEVMRTRFETEAKRELRKTASEVTKVGTTLGLPPWREVVTPHPDVASGTYQQAEFAADLAEVITGTADKEYQDPLEFFRRTYLTEGMRHLIINVLKRLNGNGGNPVVQLQTSFGGGKTHTMLALYHLISGNVQPYDVPGIDEVLQEVEISKLPKANRAVLVGTQLSVDKPRVKPDGTKVNTMWGEMAYQLGGIEGYNIVSEADKKGVAPGSDDIKEIFDRFSPAIVLIDEWVAFARNIYGKSDLPAGSFDANMTFAQTLTEGVKRSANGMVVASIPASNIEIGGEGGEYALERLQHTFGRLESVWKPAGQDESYEIVRRRLFSSEINHAARDIVVRSFVEMYMNYPKDYPSECQEARYRERLISAYPVHPELFERLYSDWSTLERFQRTRGVLRLMASVIHELWERDDRSLLIMPGTIPLDSDAVRYEMTRYLPEGWGAVVDADVDGIRARPLLLDRENPSFGRYSAARRVARTIFIGSAPTVVSQKNRGLEEARIRLGVVQPGESSATFMDALRRQVEQLTYLFGDTVRYWFDTRPSVNRLAADRISRFYDYVDNEIVSRLGIIIKEWERQKKRNPDIIPSFQGIHINPESPSDVIDDQSMRLVILPPSTFHQNSSNGGSPAIEKSLDILLNRGSGGRLYQNRLVFLASDKRRYGELAESVQNYLSWKSVSADRETLNLDLFSLRQIDKQCEHWNEAINQRIGETFQYLLIPEQDSINPVAIGVIKISLTYNNFINPIVRKLVNEDQLITEWAPILLEKVLSQWFWKEERPYVNIKTLWTDLTRYCYLPRLRDESVLLDTLRQGIVTEDYFAIADGIGPDGRYINLQFGVMGLLGRDILNGSAVVISAKSAREQIELDRRRYNENKTNSSDAGQESNRNTTSKDKKDTSENNNARIDNNVKDSQDNNHEETTPMPSRFFGSIFLDNQRVARDSSRVAEEVIQHLTTLLGSEVKVKLEIDAKVPGSFTESEIRTILENCRTLGFDINIFE